MKADRALSSFCFAADQIFIVILRIVYFMTANHAAVQRPERLLLKKFFFFIERGVLAQSPNVVGYISAMS